MLKRALDIILSAIALVPLLPVLLLVALVLRLSGEGEVFYLQERIGRNRKPFRIVKFATMLKDSPNLAGGDITVGADPRVLPMGQFLRKTKLNEVPQLWNILTGDMSIIGPRPLTPRVYAPFPETYKAAIAPLRPGLSGIGSIVFRDEERLLDNAADRTKTYAEIIMPYKAALEQWYAQHCGMLVDLKLIFLTIAAVIDPALDVSKYLDDLPTPPVELTGRSKVA
jgi:lipopolysaccharide/colanic/teichoic acid biosynthesis glycosyltransferase